MDTDKLTVGQTKALCSYSNGSAKFLNRLHHLCGRLQDAGVHGDLEVMALITINRILNGSRMAKAASVLFRSYNGRISGLVTSPNLEALKAQALSYNSSTVAKWREAMDSVRK